jgi:hypothetical protein
MGDGMDKLHEVSTEHTGNDDHGKGSEADGVAQVDPVAEVPLSGGVSPGALLDTFFLKVDTRFCEGVRCRD